MSARRRPTPSYLLHRQSGRARAVWTDQTGTRQQKLLPGPFDSPESRTAFARLQLEIEAAPHRQPGTASEVSVNEVLLAFLRYAEGHYRRPDGSTTNEVDEYKFVSRHVREVYGDTPAALFGPLALKAIRQKFIEAGWCRGFINQRIGRARRIFKWAASEELVPAAVYQSLATVTGLQRGRTAAREAKPVGPVDDATVDATLPFLNRHVRGLVELQRLTGCRPGEACAIRRCDIDTGGPVWLYKPPHHKTAWRGKGRTIAIGPKAQTLLEPFLTASITDYLFSPWRAVEEVLAERAAKRKTPRWPSHMKRNAKKRKGEGRRRSPAGRYNRLAYLTAVTRACDKAFPPPAPLARREDETAAEWKLRLTPDQKAELARGERHVAGTRTNSATPSRRRSASSTDWRPRKFSSATPAPT